MQPHLDPLLDLVPPPHPPVKPAAQASLCQGLLSRMAEEILSEVLDNPQASRLVPLRIRQRKSLGSKQRRLLRERLYALLRSHQALELLLTRGSWDGEQRPRALYLALLVAEQLCTPELAGERLGAPVFDALANPREELRAWAADRPDEQVIAVLASLPPWLVQELGERALPFALGLRGRAPLTLRVNPRRSSRDKVQRQLRATGLEVHPGALCAQALKVTGSAQLHTLKPFQAGHFEVQDEGSQLLSLLVQPGAGLTVDLCCGAGGKTLAIGARLPKGGRIEGSDVRPRPLVDARKRARRAGLKARFHQLNPDAPLPWAPGSASAVLVDAPCSGSGTLRRDPARRWRLDEPEVNRLVALQAELLDKAAELVAPGGQLIYGTCSELPRENEEQVQAFLRRHPDFHLRPASVVLGPELAGVTRGPYLATSALEHDTDGFFGAVLVRD